MPLSIKIARIFGVFLLYLAALEMKLRMKKSLSSPGYPLAPLTLGVSVVIPVADEAGNIIPLVREIVQTLDGLPHTRGDYEIIFIDDQSRDRTREDVLEAVRLFPQARVRLICHQQRYGKSQGVWTGLRNAHGQWILTMDGDGQNDPADMPRLISIAWAKHRDDSMLVSGVRVNRKGSLSRRMASRAANFIRRTFLGDDCPDTGCALKMFRRDAYLALPYFDGMHRYEPTLFRLYGHAIVYVPVNDRMRQHGVSKYTNLKRALVGLYDLMGVMWLQHRLKARDERSVEVMANPQAANDAQKQIAR